MSMAITVRYARCYHAEMWESDCLQGGQAVSMAQETAKRHSTAHHRK
jgi:hypothetical protein